VSPSDLDREADMTDLRNRTEQGRGITRRIPASAGHIAIALTVAMLGFLLAIQLRATEGLADRLAIEREADLGRILTELQTRSDQLLDEIIELRVKLAETSGSAEQERALIENARRELRALQVLLGIVPVRGEGIVLTITDPQGVVGPEVLLDAVQELRDAGAEAIEINDRRVVAQTWFGGSSGALTVDGARLSFPVTIEAIGASGTLAEAMRIPGGVVDAVGARAGATVRIQERRSVSILSTSQLPRFDTARPEPRR
jgi:uncharacterized protein YlxW (UPF0749 family)